MVVSKWKVRYEIIEKCLLKDFFKKKNGIKATLLFLMAVLLVYGIIGSPDALFIANV